MAECSTPNAKVYEFQLTEMECSQNIKPLFVWQKPYAIMPEQRLTFSSFVSEFECVERDN